MRVILMDTNVVSDLTRRQPDLDGGWLFAPPAADDAVHFFPERNTYGLARMPAGCQRNELVGRITMFLTTAFRGRMLDFGTPPRRSTARFTRHAKQPAIR